MSVIPALIVAAVLVVSGIAKLRHPDDEAGWAEMGVPAALRRPFLLRLHPWGEIVLGVAMLLLGGLLGAAAALAATALMTAYLVLVVRVVRSADDASCACFGTKRAVTRVTIIRNSWYVALSLLALATAWANPLWGGPLAAVGASGWGWIAGLAAAAITVAVTLWPEPVIAPEPVLSGPSVPAGEGVEELDYVRTRTPSVPVIRADGVTVDLRQLSMSQPLILLAVKPGCGACLPVLAKVGEWRELLPEVSVRLLLSSHPENDAAAEHDEPQSLHDPNQYVRGSIADWATPTAILLGADGMLAGGPVTGYPDISAFIEDVYESLHGERPPVSQPAD
ncbi:putative membrane protein YphA (DoxX/SURF4 family) [Microbacterium resistens]|uniref:Membrane protein YphA (DoxX/SURF4 family) n=1 Tax=Microbacterium resistens TaxID=156977 RepID=A0ABU1SCB2_9MICO|nr:MauE/DoxX family redox-associated membrane protein [Microbacterium resistens]MDR6867256.1 putative membrane protein YphA (DoxX/SURF4 family) [Microbacterium resistens]